MKHVDINPVTHTDDLVSHSNDNGLVQPDITKETVSEIPPQHVSDNKVMNDLPVIDGDKAESHEQIGSQDSGNGNVNEIPDNGNDNRDNLGDGQENVGTHMHDEQHSVSNTGEGTVDNTIPVSEIVNKEKESRDENNAPSQNDRQNIVLETNKASKENSADITTNKNDKSVSDENSLSHDKNTFHDSTSSSLSEDNNLSQIKNSHSEPNNTANQQNEQNLKDSNSMLASGHETKMTEQSQGIDKISLDIKEESVHVENAHFSEQKDPVAAPFTEIDKDVNTVNQDTVGLSNSDMKSENLENTGTNVPNVDSSLTPRPEGGEKIDVPEGSPSPVDTTKEPKPADTTNGNMVSHVPTKDALNQNHDRNAETTHSVTDNIGNESDATVIDASKALNDMHSTPDTVMSESGFTKQHGHGSSDIASHQTSNVLTPQALHGHVKHSSTDSNTLQTDNVQKNGHTADLTQPPVNDIMDSSSVPDSSSSISKKVTSPSEEIAAMQSSADNIEYFKTSSLLLATSSTVFENLSAPLESDDRHNQNSEPNSAPIKSTSDIVLGLDLQPSEVKLPTDTSELEDSLTESFANNVQSSMLIGEKFEPLVNEHNEDHFHESNQDYINENLDPKEANQKPPHSFNLLANILKEDAEHDEVVRKHSNNVESKDSITLNNSSLKSDLETSKQLVADEADMKARLGKNDGSSHTQHDETNMPKTTASTDIDDILATKSGSSPDGVDALKSIGLSRQCVCVAYLDHPFNRVLCFFAVLLKIISLTVFSNF